MAFLDIVKKERLGGSGIISSLSTAATKNTLEKIDPRNYLFRSGGTLSALFPKIKGYKGVSSKESKVSSLSSLGGMDSSMTIIKLDEINRNTSVSAKNSVVLPKIAMDINVMKLNIMKLVSAVGKPVSRNPDMFFADAKSRENMYEAQFGKKSTTPTPAAASPEKKGFLSSILGSISEFFGQGLLSLLLKGGLIGGLLVALGKYIEDPEFREKVNTFLSPIFDVMKRSIENLFGEEVWGKMITGALGLAAAFTAIQFGMAALSTSLISFNPATLIGGLVIAGSAALIQSVFGAGGKLDQWMSKNGPKPRADMKELEAIEEEGKGSYTAKKSYKERWEGILSRGGEVSSEVAQKLKEVHGIDVPQSLIKTTPTPTSSGAGSNTNGQKTFKQMSPDEQNAFLDAQYKIEGNKPGNLAHDLNNPGAMLYADWMKNYGAVRDTTRGEGNLKGKFARFPSFQHGREAQRALWLSKYGDMDPAKAISMWSGTKEGSAEHLAYLSNTFGKTNHASFSGSTGPKNPGSSIAYSSSSINDAVRSLNVPSVTVNAPQTTNVQQPSSGGMSGGLPSVVDQDFMKYLVTRAS